MRNTWRKRKGIKTEGDLGEKEESDDDKPIAPSPHPKKAQSPHPKKALKTIPQPAKGKEPKSKMEQDYIDAIKSALAIKTLYNKTTSAYDDMMKLVF